MYWNGKELLKVWQNKVCPMSCTQHWSQWRWYKKILYIFSMSTNCTMKYVVTGCTSLQLITSSFTGITTTWAKEYIKQSFLVLWLSSDELFLRRATFILDERPYAWSKNTKELFYKQKNLMANDYRNDYL